MYRRMLFSLIAAMALASAFSVAPALASKASLCSVNANGATEKEDKTCAGAGGTVIDVIKAVNVGNAKLKGTINVECGVSTFKAKGPQVISEGKNSEVVLTVEGLTFTQCNEGCTVTVLAAGEAKINEDQIKESSKAKQEGPVAVKGVQAELKCSGFTCKVESAAAGDQGKLEKEAGAQKPPKLMYNEAPTVNSGLFCGTSGKETVAYTLGTATGANEIWVASDGLEAP